MKKPALHLVSLLCYAWACCASAKRLIAFGDSITDNGNGTNSFVQAYFSQLLGQNITAVSRLYLCDLMRQHMLAPSDITLLQATHSL